MYVPDIVTNLLSARKIREAGHTIQFSPRGDVIVLASGIVILLADRRKTVVLPTQESALQATANVFTASQDL